MDDFPAPSMLFKYATADRIDVLVRAQIRFTQAAALNDPFELRPYFETLVPEDTLARDVVDKIDLNPSLRDAYAMAPADLRHRVSFEEYKAFAEAMLQGPGGQQVLAKALEETLGIVRELTPRFREDIYTLLGTKIGILSLSATPHSAPMWAHYADNHRGLIICFDGSHAFFNRKRSVDDDFYHARPVQYRHPQSFPSMAALSGNDVFYTKNPSWSYEHEWRVVIPFGQGDHTIPSPDGDVHLLPLPPDAVTGVILGTMADEETRGLVTQLRNEDPRYPHLQVLAATIESRTGEVAIDGLDAMIAVRRAHKPLQSTGELL